MRHLFLALALVGCSSSTDPAPAPTQDTNKTEPTTYVYRQHVIAFDDATAGTPITDRYQTWAKFSSDSGCTLSASNAADVASSKPMFLGGCAHAFVDFERPVAEIGFSVVGAASKDAFGTARFVKGDGSTTEVVLKGWGDPTLPVVVESHETNVVRVELVGATGLDDLVFYFPEEK